MRDELGGTYRVYKAENMRVLTPGDEASADRALDFFRRAELAILKLLPGITSNDGYGPPVLIMFDEAEDFYALMGQYFSRTYWNSTDAAFVNNGYMFVATLPEIIEEVKPQLFHVISTMMLAHLDLPYWLEQGLAVHMGKEFFAGQNPDLRLGLIESQITPEIAYDLCSHWSELNIQQFWSGESFHDADSSDISHYLAEALVGEIKSRSAAKNFILSADWQDAGETAARKHLGSSLSEVMTLFLGPGNWEPNPAEWALPK
jgi:hypothetical protein